VTSASGGWLAIEIERDGTSMKFAGWAYPLEGYFGAVERAGFAVQAVREPSFSGTGDDTLWSRIPIFLMWRRSSVKKFLTFCSQTRGSFERSYRIGRACTTQRSNPEEHPNVNRQRNRRHRPGPYQHQHDIPPARPQPRIRPQAQAHDRIASTALFRLLCPSWASTNEPIFAADQAREIGRDAIGDLSLRSNSRLRSRTGGWSCWS